MSQTISGAVALVTGANRERGIGRAIVRALLERGAARVYAGGRDVAALASLEREFPGRLIPLQVDVEDPAQVARAASAAGDVSILVNNAGVVGHAGAPLVDAGWHAAGTREMSVNVFGTLAMTQAFAPILAANGGGTIVNVVSVAGLAAFPLLVTYSASKAALRSLTQSTRAMLRAQGTRVIAVYPGPVDTEMADGIDMSKVSPAEIATATLDAVTTGLEEVYPDPAARQIGTLFDSGPKAAEEAVAAM